MPRLTKEAMSQYIRTQCKRQLRLYLSPDKQEYRAERVAEGMPAPQPPRPGLEQIAQAGEEWEAKVLEDLAKVFGQDAVVGNPYLHSSGQTRYDSVALREVLADAPAASFIVEAQFEIGAALEAELGISNYRSQYHLDYAEVRPDIIEVLPARTFHESGAPSGEVRRLDDDDRRRQLRVVDIKLTAKPSPSYFIQVAYYSMALSGWLVDHDLDDDLVVVPDAAIWPGSHQASNLITSYQEILSQGRTPMYPGLRAAMEEDLERVPFEVFAFRVRRFLQEDLLIALNHSWQELDWHVDNRCSTCEYLGYPWLDSQGDPTNEPKHCMPTAQRTDHLCRIAFLSRGASAALQSGDVGTVNALSHLAPDDAAFDAHQTLRASRTVVAGRARALQTKAPRIPPLSGTSASMPRWADLRIYLSADFDIGSAVTFALGARALWIGPPDSTGSRQFHRWPDQVFVVDRKDLATEREETLAFLDHIHTILTEASSLGNDPSVQFYLWDSLQYDHLMRIFGRHLEAILADEDMRYLAWLFPPEDVLPNPDAVVRRSPITIVRDVVRALLAAPIPHYYTLLETARVYHHNGLPDKIAEFSIHPLFEDCLSDQIPSERAHDIWSNSSSPGPALLAQMETLEETVKKRLSALATVVRRLEGDLRESLRQESPEINIGPPHRETRLSFDGQLWYAFAKLNAALEELETLQKRAKPPHEREAKFSSARLRRRIGGTERQDILDELGLRDVPGRRVYQMRENSREVKIQANDFNCALAPENRGGFLDQTAYRALRGTPLQEDLDLWWGARMEHVTSVTVKAIDRDNARIVVDPNDRWPSSVLDDLERHGVADLSTDAILDPIHSDFFTPKLKAALKAIGNPASARDNSLVRRATGQITGRGSNQTAHTPAADFLWNATEMCQIPVTRDLESVKPILAGNDLDLNPSQWHAWAEALSHRLHLIWGPPGTGKSRTARAIIVGAAVEAYHQGRSMRILVCSATYRAMDNVLVDAYKHLRDLLPADSHKTSRLRSRYRQQQSRVPSDIDVALDRRHPSPQVKQTLRRLEYNDGITIVGATPSQAQNLLRILDDDRPQRELFDLVLIDEASQMDVAHAILPLCALAEEGSVVLAGDPKQLAPIHQAEAPLGLDSMVGSIYDFYREFHGIPDSMLETNYRSNSTVVDFSLRAGYRATLRSNSPDLRLNLVRTLPVHRPADWPEELYWTRQWSQLLDPDHPTVCFVYREGRSSQWNEFEADAVGAIIYSLFERLGKQLLNENGPDGNTAPAGDEAYSPAEFWKKAVGVVTPHRAQRALIVSKLQRLFAGPQISPGLIRDAVDTVERFQGQQRDIMIASFALGDPDAIRDEDEFLMSLNRFNVMSSRARAKLVVLVSQEVVDHLSADLDVLRDSRLLKVYAESFCNSSRPMTLGFMEDGTARTVSGLFRYRA